MSKIEWKILGFWFLIVILLRLSLLFPHRYLDDIRLINTWIQALLCIISVVLAWKSAGAQRHIYINFAVLFGFVMLRFSGSFVMENIPGFYYHAYVNMMGDAVICTFVILFIVVDYIFRNKSAPGKYLITVLITGLIILLTFSPYIYNPFELDHEKDYTAFERVEKVWTELSVQLDRKPNNEEILLELSALPDVTGDEYRLIASQINKWRGYVESNAGTTLFWRPLFGRVMVNDITLCILLAVILSIIYRLDKPYHAYVDKILLLMIPLYALEAFHDWNSSTSVSMEEFRLLFTIGQYMTVFIFVFLVYVFHFSLRFTESPVSAYYEEALNNMPLQITRWRDEIDTLIIKLFTNSSHFTRRVADIGSRKGDKVKQYGKE